MYESLNMFFLEVTRWNVDKILDTSPHSYFSQVKSASQLFHGITARTMPRDEAWAFLDCGMFLERADKTARILDVKYHILLGPEQLGGTLDQHQWIAVLKSVGAFEAFRKAQSARYHAGQGRLLPCPQPGLPRLDFLFHRPPRPRPAPYRRDKGPARRKPRRAARGAAAGGPVVYHHG